MEPDLAGWNINLVGAWNTAILSPTWLARHVLEREQAQYQLLLAVNQEEQRRLVFADDGFALEISAHRLLFSPLSTSRRHLDGPEVAARRLLGVLTHTPLAGIGINFRYRAPDGNEMVNGLLQSPDVDQLSDIDLAIELVEFRRQLTGVQGFGSPVLFLKFTLGAETGEVIADFNYHWGTPQPTQAASALDGAFAGLHAHVRRVLSAYGVDIAEVE